jgi:hypothetical protein
MRRGRATKVRAAAIAAMALLGGCMVGPDYKRPEVPTPAAFRYEPASVTQTADTEWWKQFGDPVLDGYIAEALAHNKNVEVAVASVYAALQRLEDKGLVTSRFGNPTPERGGRAKKFFKVTGKGLRSLLARVVAKEMHKSVLTGLHQLRSRLGS